nr:tetratricopeptide repeat protein [Saprospiraceae bacterium]
MKYNILNKVQFLLFLFLSLAWVSVDLCAQDFDFSELVEEESPNLESEFIEARKHMFIGEYQEAADKLEALLIKDPNNAVFLYELARSYDQLNQKEKALDAAEKAHIQDAQNEWILHTLANLASELNRNELAEQAYAKLLIQFPSRSNYAISRAYHLLLSSERKKALQVLNQIEENIGVNPEVSAKKISILKGDGDMDRIGMEYQKLMDAFPRNIDIKMEYASFLQLNGNLEEAAEVYGSILENNPNHGRAQLSLAELESGEVSEDHRLKALLPIIGNPSVDPDEKIKSLIPLLLSHSESYDQALARGLREATGELVNLHPDKAEIHALAGDVAYSSFQFVEAMQHYSNALELRTNVIQVWFNYLEAILRTRDYAKLINASEKGVDFYPNQALFQYYLSRAKIGLGEIDEAESNLRRAELMGRRLKGLTPYLAMSETLIKVEENNYSEAENIIDRALEEFPNDPDLLMIKIKVLQGMDGDRSRIQSLIDRVEKLRPYDPELLFLKSKTAYAMEDFSGASKMVDELVNYDSFELSYLLNWAYKVYSETDPTKAEDIMKKLNQTQ